MGAQTRILVLVLFAAAFLGLSSVARAQSTGVSTEYVGTLYVPLDPPQVIDSTLQIYRGQTGGWFRGPKINAQVLQPGADWLRIMPSQALRLDVRLSLLTDDNQYIYMTYSGVIVHSKESFDRLLKGEVLSSKDHYFITVPQMQTAAEKYAWVNYVQFVGKIVEVKVGEGSYVKYDIFALK